MRREGRRNIHLTFDWGHRIPFPTQHEGRTLHPREDREQIERGTLSPRPREPARDFRMADRALYHQRIARGARVEREGQTEPGVKRGFVCVSLEEPAAGEGADFWTAEAFKQGHSLLA